MQISSFNSFSFSVLLIACAVVLLIASRNIYQTSPRFFGAGSPLRVAIESVLLIFAIASPLLLVDLLILLNVKTTWIELLIPRANSFFLVISFALYPSLIPLWMAIRLAPPRPSEGRSLLVLYTGITVFFFLIVFIGLVFSFSLGPVPILLYRGRFDGQFFNPGALTQALVLTLWIILLFLSARALIKLVGNPPELSKESELNDIIAVTEGDETNFYNLLVIGIVFALIIWFSSVSVYALRLEDAYFPVRLDPSKELGLPFAILNPFERSHLVSFVMLSSSLLTLLSSLFISVYVRPGELAAKLFALLGLLYGLATIDVFPLGIGPFLYVLTVLAKVYIIPTQMHFAMVFPRKVLTIKQMSNERKWYSPRFLYIIFIPLAMFTVAIFLQQIDVKNMILLLNELIKEGQSVNFEFIALFIGVAIWATVSALFLLATVFGWTFSIVLLWRNYRTIQRRREILLKSLDRKETTISTEFLRQRERLAAAVQQFKWVFMGAGIAVLGMAITFLLFLPFPIFNEGGWSDAILRLSLFAIFSFTAFAMIKFRLWDVDRLLQRTLIFTTLVIFFTTVLEFLLESLITRLFPEIQQLSQELLNLLSALLAAVLAYVTERPVEDYLDQVFFSGRLAAFRKTDELNKLIKESSTIKTLVNIFIELVPDRLGYSAAWIKISRKLHIAEVVAELRRVGAILFFPLENMGEQLGIYAVGPKLSERQPSKTDQNLLMELSQTAARRLAGLQAAGVKQIRVLIIGNKRDTAFAQLLAESLEKEYDIVGIITNKEDVNIGAVGQADVIVLIVGAIRRIRIPPVLQQMSITKLLVLLQKVDKNLEQQVKRAGGQGCVEKTNLEEINHAIHNLYHGKTWFH